VGAELEGAEDGARSAGKAEDLTETPLTQRDIAPEALQALEATYRGAPCSRIADQQTAREYPRPGFQLPSQNNEFLFAVIQPLEMR